MNSEKRVLIIDDEEMICTILMKFIQKLVDDNAPLVAMSANEGLLKLKEHSSTIKLAIIDYNLNDMSCKELVESIRGINKDIKIYLSTGLNAVNLIDETGCDGALQKPFTIPDVKNIIDSIEW